MLEIRQYCENCGKALPNESDEAMICSYECTFCSDCVRNVISNVCPNCGGGFESRPTRPARQLRVHPASETKLIRPVETNKYLEKYKDTDPRSR